MSRAGCEAPAAHPQEVQGDPEMAEFAREEITEMSSKLKALEEKIKLLLLPKWVGSRPSRLIPAQQCHFASFLLSVCMHHYGPRFMPQFSSASCQLLPAP